MTKIKMDDFVSMVAEVARFTKGDVHIILNAMIKVIEYIVENGDELNIRSFGKIYIQDVKERRTKEFYKKDGTFVPAKVYPPSKRVIFRLAENIRYKRKENGD